MEKKKNNGLIVAFIIVIVVAVLGIGGAFYFYNKSLTTISNDCKSCMDKCDLNEEILDKKTNDNENKTSEEIKVNSNNNLDELKKIEPFKEYDELGILIYLEKYYLNYLPNKNQSFLVKDLSDEDISLVSWLYIYDHTENNNRSIAKYHIDNFLNEYFDLHNYELKTIKNEDEYSFGLKKENNQYVISIPSGEWMFPVYRAKSFVYDQSSKEIKVDFYKRVNDLSFITDKEGTVIFKITKTEPVANISLLSVEYK